MTDDSLDTIERQLDKMQSTAGNLETLAYKATKAGNNTDASALQEQAEEIRLRQFMLYRKKEGIEVSSKEWRALISSMNVINQFIGQSLDDLKQIIQVLATAKQLASIADSVLKSLAGV